MKYTEGLKREMEEMKVKHGEGLHMLDNLQNQDWSKLIIDLKNENEVLRDELVVRNKEMTEMKTNLSMSLQVAGSSSQSHLGNVLENQSQQLVRMRRLVEEFEKREKQCNRKWTALLQENQSLQEKLAGQRQ
mmetsp:Transcript_696/g.757  ORF Transcript_696/g.757 Transcript_696/m.757 type:complete len:132 (+) Transcript_696:43-438(+)